MLVIFVSLRTSIKILITTRFSFLMHLSGAPRRVASDDHICVTAHIHQNLNHRRVFIFNALNRRNQRCSQPRNQGGAGDETPPSKSFAPLEKCVGHSLKLLDIV